MRRVRVTICTFGRGFYGLIRLCSKGGVDVRGEPSGDVRRTIKVADGKGDGPRRRRRPRKRVVTDQKMSLCAQDTVLTAAPSLSIKQNYILTASTACERIRT